jgi:hypothetical protein
VARLAPVLLTASAQVRLRRLAPDAIYREDSGQLIVPLVGAGRAADVLRELLAELIPPTGGPPVPAPLPGGDAPGPAPLEQGVGAPTSNMLRK